MGFNSAFKGLKKSPFTRFSLTKTFQLILTTHMTMCRRSQWARGLKHSSEAARLLRSWVRIPPGTSMFVCCECCVLSGTDLCDELITRPEESYRLWCVFVCDLENLVKEKTLVHWRAVAPNKKNYDNVSET